MPTIKTLFEPYGDSNCLVVLVHGYHNAPNKLAHIKKEIKSHIPNADLLLPTYEKGFFVSANPFALASGIETAIHEAFNNKQSGNGTGYEKIILIGFSIGALLLRKAYVYGMGSTEDHAIYKGRTAAHDWVNKVDRIILIAGINRGWSLEEKPNYMNPIKFYFWRNLVAPVLRAIPFVADFLGDLERGSPFVSNLRLQWIQLAEENRPLVAPVFQLLGSIDSLVTAADDRDLYVHRDFTFIPVHGASHDSLMIFDDTDTGRRCKNKFVEALVENIDELKMKYEDEQPMTSGMVNSPEAHIIFVLHGIRDYAVWTQSMRAALKRFADVNQLPEPKVFTPSYDYFSMLEFIFLPNRQKHVRWFMDQYTESLAEYPNPKSKVSFIGHSNGTYILASALEKYRTMKIYHASFAGSVVPRRYDWEKIITREGRVKMLRNDLAASDWAVALFPKLFEQLNRSDIGSGGFDGFIADVANQHQGDKYYIGGHGAAIAPENHKSIAKFILTGRIERDDKLLRKTPAPWLFIASKLCIFIWLLALAAFLGGLWGIYALGNYLSIHINVDPNLIRLVLGIIYVALVRWLLHVI